MTAAVPPDASSGDTARARLSRLFAHPVARAWLLLALVTTVPYAKAALDPPPGRTFVGTFHWTDDVFLYLSFAQQAEDGHVLFENRAITEPHRAALVNVEWWATGALSRILGRRPLLAFRLVGLVAAIALLSGLDRWLVHARLPETHRLPALLLIAVGGGLGGVIFELTPLPISRAMDLATGVYPFLALLFQPHWVASAALLVWSLWTQTNGRGRAGLTAAALTGTALGLTRPYDLALLLGIRATSIVAFEDRRSWPGAIARLATLAPVLAYDAWLFTRPAYGTFSSAVFARFTFPPIDQLAALAPPLLLAALAYRRGCWGPAVRPFEVWLPLVALILWVKPLSLPNQFAVGWGVPALVLLALALGRWRPAVTLAAAAFLAASFVVAMRVAWRGDPNWHVPSERWAAPLAMRESCRDGGVLLGPADMGLYTIGLTRCRAWVSHQAAPGYAERLAAVSAFYRTATPAERAALADRACATHVVLPGDVAPDAWLGSGSGFRTAFVVRAAAVPIQVAVRPRPARCPAL